MTTWSRPYTPEHFEEYAYELTLDNGERWVVEPFQLEIVADVFHGYREVWTIIPEGNAKTTLFAGIALYHLDHTLAPWVPLGAATRDQAEILFRQAEGFIQRSSELQARMTTFGGYRKITHARNGGTGLKVYAYDPRGGDGVIPTLGIVDEGHRHPDMRLYRLWKGKLNKRKGYKVVFPNGAPVILTRDGEWVRYDWTDEDGDELLQSDDDYVQMERVPQIFMMSTAGEPGTEFEQVRESIRIQTTEHQRDGAHLRAEGPNLVYHEWMVQSLELAKDLHAVKRANPLSAIDEEYLQEKLEGPTLDFGQDWLRLTCNIAARSSQAAIPEADWEACATSDVIPEGTPVYLGADHAWLVDCTALVPLWMREWEYRLFGKPTIITPPRDGTVLPAQDVKDAYEEVFERYDVQAVVMDITKAEDIAQWIAEEKDIEVIDRGQTNALAAEDYERWMAGMSKRYLLHPNDPEFTQHVMNAIQRRLPSDKNRFDRPSTSRNTVAGRQERRVIDALTAASMVHSYAVGEYGGEGEILVSFG